VERLRLPLGKRARPKCQHKKRLLKFRLKKPTLRLQRRRQEAATGDPDVLLDVPNLSVEEITLEVENLRARVSLDAKLANLLSLTAGADVGIDKVKLTIKGVRAEVLLKVRLDNVAAIIDRTLTTIDRNPQILERLLQSVDNTVGTVVWRARRSGQAALSHRRSAT
jgi:hypothetical protein